MQKRTPLATEILKEEHRRTKFWRMAFAVTLAVTVVRHFMRKAV